MKTKKIKLEDIGLDKTYYPVIDTHNSAYEGGHKIHIKNFDTGRALCGYEPFLASAVPYEQNFNSIFDFLNQSDPDNCICKRCKQILISKTQL